MISRKNVNGTDCLLQLVTRAPVLQDRYLQITLGDLCGWATVLALLERREENLKTPFNVF